MKKIIARAEAGTTTNLFELPNLPKQLRESNKLITTQCGILTVLIHPFFHQILSAQFRNTPTKEVVRQLLETDTDLFHYSRVRHQTGFLRKKIEVGITELNARSYYHRLKNLLTHSHTLLLALGEYGPYVSTTIALLREFGFNGNLLVYETKSGSPEPEKDQGTWDSLARSLETLNMTRLIVAGQLSSYSNTNLGPKSQSGCVPNFAINIQTRLDKRRKTEVILSPVTYPNWWTEK